MDRADFERFIGAMQKMRRIFIADRTANQPLSQIEYFALMFIRINQEKNVAVNTAMLSEHLFVGKSAVSQMLNSLEDKGFVERSVNRQDRRLFDLNITQAGADVLREQKEKFLSVLLIAFEKMGDGEASEFVRLLEKFAECFAGAER